MIDWWRRRRRRRAEQMALRRQLHREYFERMEARDPVALEAARDWRRLRVQELRANRYVNLYIVILFLSVGLLILFFEALQSAIGK